MVSKFTHLYIVHIMVRIICVANFQFVPEVSSSAAATSATWGTELGCERAQAFIYHLPVFPPMQMHPVRYISFFASKISILQISSCVLNALQCCDILGINCIFSKNQLRADEQTGNDRGSKCLLGGTFHYDICTHIPQSAMAVWLPSVFVYSVSHYAELDCMLWPGMIHIAVFTGRNES